jgi:hypothetical protein
MDKDDFEQWRESAATKWFMGKVAERAKHISAQLNDHLFAMAAHSPADWATHQPHAAYEKGASEAMMAVTVYTLEDLEPQEDKKA